MARRQAVHWIDWIAPWKTMSPKTMLGMMHLYLVAVSGTQSRQEDGRAATPTASPQRGDTALRGRVSVGQMAPVGFLINLGFQAPDNIYEAVLIARSDDTIDTSIKGLKSIRKEVGNVARKAAEEATKEFADKAMEQLKDKKGINDAAKAVKKTSLEVGRKAGEEAGKKTARELIRKAQSEATDEMVDKMVEEVAGKEAKKQAEKVSRKVTKTGVKKATEKMGKDTLKKAGEASKKGSAKATKAITTAIAKKKQQMMKGVDKAMGMFQKGAKILAKLGPVLGIVGPALSIISIFTDGPSAELQEIQAMREEMKEQFEKTQQMIQEGFSVMRERFDQIENKLDELGQTIEKVGEDVKSNVQFAIAVNTYREKRVALKTMHQLFNAFTENVGESHAREAFYYQCKQYNPWLLVNWIYEHMLIHDLPDGAPDGMYGSILKAVGPDFTLLQEWNKVIKDDVVSIALIYSSCLGIISSNATSSKYQLSEMEKMEAMLPKIEEKMVRTVEMLQDGLAETYRQEYAKIRKEYPEDWRKATAKYGFVDWILVSHMAPPEHQRCTVLDTARAVTWCRRITPEERKQAIKIADSICDKTVKTINFTDYNSYINAMLPYFKPPCRPDMTMMGAIQNNSSCFLELLCNSRKFNWIIDPYNATLPYGPSP